MEKTVRLMDVMRMASLRWRGIMAGRDAPSRAVAAGVALVLIASIVLTQRSLIALGSSGALLPLLLNPIAMGTILLGTIDGCALGALAGVALAAHAHLAPLDIHELTLTEPLSSVCLYAVFGLVLGVLLSLALPKARSKGTTAAAIAGPCLVAAVLHTAGLVCLTPFAPTPAGLVLQVLAGCAITSIPCLVCAAIFAWRNKTADDIGVREAFQSSILLVVVFAFIITSTISHLNTTQTALRDAEKSMAGEVDYLSLQLDAHARRADAFGRIIDAAGVNGMDTTEDEGWQLLTNPAGEVLDGYAPDKDGTVLIARDSHILASDDERVREGDDLAVLGDDVVAAIEASARTGEVQRIVCDGALAGPDEGAQVGFLLAAQQGDYTILVIQPESMVFAGLPEVMGRELAITLILLVAVFVIVSALLSVTVADRIDETNETLGRICAGELEERVTVAGTREFKSLSAGINHTVDTMVGLIDEVNRRIQQDLETARSIQEGAIPRHFPAFPAIDAVDLFAHMDAAKRVGGDFYDFFEVDERTIAFLIADVSGKGIPGALFMMVAKTEIQHNISSGMGLAAALAAANDYLCANNEAGMFVTVWAATLDHTTGELTYVNAGHNPPLMYHDDTWEWLMKRGGLFLGTFEGATYRTSTLTLSPGDKIVLYTDGVNEAFNTKEEEYGNDRLYDFVCAHGDARPHDLVCDLRADVAVWAAGAEQSDDVTILALEYDGDNGTRNEGSADEVGQGTADAG